MTKLSEEWQFSRYVPDADDFAAKVKACDRYMKLVADEHYSEIDWFHAGFVRGMAWMKFKMEYQDELSSNVRNAD